MTIKTLLLVGLLRVATAEEQFPFIGSTPFGTYHPLENSMGVFGNKAKSDTYSVPNEGANWYEEPEAFCKVESSFFKTTLNFKDVTNHVFTLKGTRHNYVGVDQPFGDEANWRSALEYSKENANEPMATSLLEGEQISPETNEVMSQVLAASSEELKRANEMVEKLKDVDTPEGVDVRKRVLEHRVKLKAKVDDLLSRAEWLVKDKEQAEKKNILHKPLEMRQRTPDLFTPEEKSQKEEERRQKWARTHKTFQTWYVNSDSQKSRSQCLVGQLGEANITPQRFSALALPDCSGAKDYAQCLSDAGFADCVRSGVDMAATATHSSKERKDGDIRNAVVSNWCGHKRLFEKFHAEADKTDEEFFVILEDDVVIDRRWFKDVIEDFITDYKGPHDDWDLLQLDPFGDKDERDLVGHFRGKPVWKPTLREPCSHYWGFQAIVVRKSSLARTIEWMNTNKVVPVDWLGFKMPKSLAFSALIARNPESMSEHHGHVEAIQQIVLPAYCSEGIMRSTIARQMITEKMFSKDWEEKADSNILAGPKPAAKFA